VNRRRFLRNSAAAAGAALAATGAVGLWRGVRFPPPQFEVADDFGSVRVGPGLWLDPAGAIGTDFDDDGRPILRACAPEPEIAVVSAREQPADFTLANVHRDAVLEVDGRAEGVVEVALGMERRVRVLTQAGSVRLRWRHPDGAGFRFAAIGDTGGRGELAWCLERAAALGASFLVHLGDFFYEPGDVWALQSTLARSPIPLYGALGNHDFNDNGVSLHGHFARVVGPRNFTFRHRGVRFVNFDTAADFLPWNGGGRARILDRADALRDDGERDRVYFTHRPMSDPTHGQPPEEEHVLPEREGNWLLRRLLGGRDSATLLCGHLHFSAEVDDGGVYTWISGDGLGLRDLVGRRSLARILVGTAEPGTAVEYRWHDLAMPLAARCHEKAVWVLHATDQLPERDRLADRCGYDLSRWDI
jgi:hypothetical protein